MSQDKPSKPGQSWDTDGGADVIDPDRPIPTARGVLSAAEVQALLRPDLSDMPGDDTPTSIKDQPVPDLPSEEERALQERRIEAGQMAARLSLTLGQSCGVKAAINLKDIVSHQRTHGGFVFGNGSACALCFGARDDSVEALIILPGDLADAIIAKACGAPPMVCDTGRLGDSWALSAIDCALLEQLLPPMGRAVRSDLRLIAIETDMTYVASLLAPETFTHFKFSVQAPAIESGLSVVVCQANKAAARPIIEPAKLPVTALLTARLASLNVPLSRITALKAGSTLLLGLPADQPVEVLSGGRDGPVLMEGSVGRRGNSIAVKITGLNRSLIKGDMD